MFKKAGTALIAAVMLAAALQTDLVSAARPAWISGAIFENKRTLVPLRPVAEFFEAEVAWSARTQDITIEHGETRILLKSGSNQAVINGKPIALDVPVTVAHGTTYVPLRFVAESLGAQIDNWNSYAQIVTLSLGDKKLEVGPRKLEVPNERRATLAYQRILSSKLNEAADLSRIKQVRTHFRPYFTDRFINKLIQEKGLDFDYPYKDIGSWSLSYRTLSTARLSEYYSLPADLKRNVDPTSYRDASLVFTDGRWKVDDVSFEIVEHILFP
ncbi:copper amine oxidase N-terminal domain-containing protein [Saccharibacillus alkalitolerans]|uniref:Copper amine oxidase N-terminal domain-containing protein n=1 Tax=Saccharibacillus alkalitolerans TaxID=2705290 RepID=A0ABX0F4R5_9BACL|nr:copper amine oxidase N-terminal domain-containing protein [Saccharibacillus alkalitolerans]NGZ74598.1 copper amine oxidase N-terminal domain-containing protein [Saccharibacillus alkalitolerans]